MLKRLTTKTIDTLPPSKGKRYEVGDEIVRGLHLPTRRPSMGRLTLNMLLSFAQFEREVTGERIRDKIDSASRAQYPADRVFGRDKGIRAVVPTEN
jgi:hypothetical protein